MSEDLFHVLSLASSSIAALDLSGVLPSPMNSPLLVYDFAPAPRFVVPTRRRMQLLGSEKAICGIAPQALGVGSRVGNANYDIFVNESAQIEETSKVAIADCLNDGANSFNAYRKGRLLEWLAQNGIPATLTGRDHVQGSLLTGFLGKGPFGNDAFGRGIMG